ncbi:helix-turn-helix domain-containing protein [Aquimarina sp. M1]
MIVTRFLVVFIFMVVPCTLKSQTEKKENDSLLGKSYEGLQELYLENRKNLTVATLYANTFLDKAKKEDDPIKIADGYHFLFMISTPDIAMKYVDSIIEITKDLNHFNYPSRGYLNKGVLLQNYKKYNEAFEYSLKAKEFAEKNNNDIHQVAAAINMANLKRNLGKENETLDILKSNYAFLQTKDIKKRFYRHYVSTVLSMAVIYNRKKKLDSARIYIEEGLQIVSKGKENYGYSGLLLASGINDYHRQNYLKAIDSLQKLLTLPLQLEYQVYDIETNLFLAKAYDKIDQPEKSLTYLLEADKLIDTANYNTSSKKAIDMLLSVYKRKKNTKEQLVVLERMLLLDSVFNEKNKKLHIEVYQKYDRENLIREKNTLLQKQEQKSLYIYLILSFIIVSFALLFFRNRKKRIFYKKKFDLLMQQQKPEKVINNVLKETKTLDLPQELVDQILRKLEIFEKENKFTDGTITSAKLAKKIGTNSTYLSKVINYYKGKNFANYVNDLRVDYAVDQIKNNPNYRKYTLKSIGEEIGFNNIQSFTKAFYKKTGIKPSYFIKQIENQ